MQIFNRKVFKDANKVIRRMEHGVPEDDYFKTDEKYDDEQESSVFDYILGMKLGLVPYNGMKGAWKNMTCDTLSPVTHRRFMSEKCDRHISEIVNSAKVHEDLFAVGYFDVTQFFAAFFVDSQAYKLLCMQWDSFKEIFRGYYTKLEEESIAHLQITCPLMPPFPYMFVVDRQSRRVWLSAWNYCTQRVYRTHSNKADIESINSYKVFTSQIGVYDLFINNAVYDNELADSYLGLKKATQFFPNVSKVTPVGYPTLKTSESFFDDQNM